MKTDVTLRDVTSVRVDKRTDEQFWLKFGDYTHETVTIFADGEARETLSRWAGESDLLKQQDALLDAARAAERVLAAKGWRDDGDDPEQVALRKLREALALCDEQEVRNEQQV